MPGGSSSDPYGIFSSKGGYELDVSRQAQAAYPRIKALAFVRRQPFVASTLLGATT
jgi:aryl-alcohol dehydrogenase-like predicted oxidoreductase